ncbi:MAG: dienelactone hydrolase [Gammaproteobacteria bacterium]|nr:dienelactone hydrolase [Gammaproteobacteria bacterium]
MGAHAPRAFGRGAAVVCAALLASPALAERVPSVYGADAPQLAALGPDRVGYRTLTLVEHDQPDVLAYDSASGRVPQRDRTLVIDLWYPALASASAPHVVYRAAFPSEPPAPPAPFTIPGIAVRDAKFAGHDRPLVIVSHGYSNQPVAMSWITENLASKGYVVAAIRHEDPPITDKAKFVGPLVRRPLDIAFVAAALQRDLAAKHWIDPRRTALLGYSMGGYGVLTAAGATLDPHSPVIRAVPGGALAPYLRGGPRAAALDVAHLRAVVAISPAGGSPWNVWGAAGLAGIDVPLLLINGDQDRTVGYTEAARAFFDEAVHARRYLLTFREGGHDIGLDPTPPQMRNSLWNEGWFQDPVWSTERVNAINAHFITAFLDRYVKGDASREAYLDLPVVESDRGVWPASVPGGYDAYSPGSGGVTVWKGFRRPYAIGLEWRSAAPQPR